jgi:hypothetical protein
MPNTIFSECILSHMFLQIMGTDLGNKNFIKSNDTRGERGQAKNMSINKS